mgnify:CR=1 FL=1
MSEKKVVIFIVEGPSDEAALGTIMKEYFSSNEVQFIVVHGDITLKDCVSSATILKKINEQIEGVKNRYRYSQDVLFHHNAPQNHPIIFASLHQNNLLAHHTIHVPNYKN